MSEIIKDLLYQCSFNEAPEEVRSVRPRLLVNLTHSPSVRAFDGMMVLNAPLFDQTMGDVDLPVFWSAVRLVERMITDGHRVVVHCRAGRNRSGLVVATVLCKHHLMTGQEAIDFLREKRAPNVLSNESFCTWLRHIFPGGSSG